MPPLLGPETTMSALRTVTLLTLGLAATASAQDIIGDNFTGQSFTINSHTGVGTMLGLTGKTGHNAMARSGKTLIVNEISGSGTTAQHFLDVVDEQLGTVTRSVQVSADLRGLATSQASQLLGVAQASPSDLLVTVDLLNGTITPRGPLGFGGVQALTRFQNTFYAWDVTAGLLKVDFLTGAATDVNPGLGTGGAVIQFLIAMSDGRLLGGQDSLYEIDVATGVPTLIGGGGYTDLRGAEERFGSAVPFGSGCGGINVKTTGNFAPNTVVSTISLTHPANAAGVVMLGLSTTQYQGLTLPLNLDPLLGTSGCSLLVAPEFNFPLAATPTGLLRFQFTLPAATNGLIFHLQHLGLAPVQGGLAFTNANTVRVAL